MCLALHEMSSDMSFEIVTRQIDGSQFAFEVLGRGTNTGAVGPIPATGRSIVIRNASVGSVSAQGLVLTHRDYWDMASLLVQLGVLPAAG
jgi:hypothetical protein